MTKEIVSARLTRHAVGEGWKDMSQSLQKQKPEERRFYLDVLRVSSIFFIILLHASAQFWYTANVRSFSWLAMNFYDAVSRWSVPVFAMISGVLFLNRVLPVRRILRKYVLRIVLAFLFWSALYALVNHLYGAGWKQTVKSFFLGPAHFWYLFMIAGMYLILPFLKKISENARLSKYYCMLSLIFAFLIPQSIAVLKLFSRSGADLGNQLVGKLQLYFVLGFPFYFLLGYWLDKVRIENRQYRLVCALGFAGFLLTFLLSTLASRYKHAPVDLFFDYFTLNVMLAGVLVFVLVKRRFDSAQVSPRTRRIFANLSSWSFGAYLCHALIQILLNRVLHFNAVSVHAAIGVPLLSLAVFILSFLVSGLLHQIPGLRKYIV